MRQETSHTQTHIHTPLLPCSCYPLFLNYRLRIPLPNAQKNVFQLHTLLGFVVEERKRERERERGLGFIWKDAGRVGMAYVDHTFSIRDDDTGTFIVHNGPPIKEIALAVSLLSLGLLGMVFGVVMAVYQIGGDSGHGIAFAILGALLFMPGFYYTRIAYYAYKGYKGFSFSNIPAV